MPAGRMHPADAGLMRLPPGGRERTRAYSAPEPGACRRGLPSPGPRFASGGPTFGRPKVGGKTAGETPDPLFCPIGRLQGGCPVATEFPQGLRPPRNRCGALRTSPDGPRDDGCFFVCNDGYIYPFKRATAEAGRATRRRSDAKGQRFSGCPVSNPIQTDWAKAGVQPSGGPARRGLACFWVLFARAKSTPGPGRGGPGAKSRSGWLRMHPGTGGGAPAAFPPARRQAHQPSGGAAPVTPG